MDINGVQISVDPALKSGEWYIVYGGTRTGRIRGEAFSGVWLDEYPSKTKLEECVDNWKSGRYMRGFRYDQAWHRFKQDVAKFAKDGLEAVEVISKAKESFGGYPPPQPSTKKSFTREHERNRRRPF